MDKSIGILDKNATGALIMMIQKCTNFEYLIVNLSLLGDMYVMWRNKKTVLELVNDENIPKDKMGKKIHRIEFFKNVVLKNTHTDTTIFGMRKDQFSPIVIADGIHRSIGIQRALQVDPNIKEKITLRILLFEGVSIYSLDDYRLSIS